MTLEKVYVKLPTEKDCINFLESAIWDNSPICPYCKSKNSTILSNSKRYHCNNCNTSYSVTVNTIFHKTRIPIQKWIYVICLKEQNKLNIPLRELGLKMGFTKDTANRVVNKVNNFYFQNIVLFNAINHKINNNE